jgi:hypothetical protein
LAHMRQIMRLQRPQVKEKSAFEDW